MPSSDNQSVIDYLQTAASLHWTAIENYLSQSFFYSRWGYEKLAECYLCDANEERGHLSIVVARLEYYGTQVTFAHDEPAWPRHDYQAAIAANYAFQTKAAGVEQKAILACREVGDEGSAVVFATLLAGSEGSIREIEATQRAIGVVGIDSYLAGKVS